MKLIHAMADVLAGNVTSKGLVIAVAGLTFFWMMVMDFPMWLDWLIGKLSSNEFPFPV